MFANSADDVSDRPQSRKLRRPYLLALAGVSVLAIASGSITSGSVASVAVASGGPDSGSSAAFATSAAGASAASDARVNNSLAAMARLFAGAVADENIRRQIHAGVAQRFDGDANVLYQELAKSSDVRRSLATAYSRGQGAEHSEALSAVDRMAHGIPRFQVAVPVKFDSWNPADYTPLVAYMPVGVEDTTLKTITAYDAAGRAHVLDAQVEPAQPVIVLGLNERTDNSGALLQEEQDEASSDQMMTAASSAYAVRMVKVKVINDNEPWPRGDAEISLRAKGCGLAYTDHNWSSLNHDEDWWYGPRWLGQTSCYGIFYWWEDDGGDWDFTLSYKGISLQVHMDDGDDRIGGVKLLHGKFGGGTNNKVEWSDLVQWTD